MKIRNVQQNMDKYLKNTGNNLYDNRPENPINKLCKYKTLGKLSLRENFKTIMEYNTNWECSKIAYKDFLKLIKIIPSIETKNEDDKIRQYKESTCKGCCETFDKGYKLTRHLKLTKIV